MGEVIRKGSAAGDVLADVATTLRNARAKGGVWESAAEEKLAVEISAAEDIYTEGPVRVAITMRPAEEQ